MIVRVWLPVTPVASLNDAPLVRLEDALGVALLEIALRLLNVKFPNVPLVEIELPPVVNVAILVLPSLSSIINPARAGENPASNKTTPIAQTDRYPSLLMNLLHSGSSTN